MIEHEGGVRWGLLGGLDSVGELSSYMKESKRGNKGDVQRKKDRIRMK